MSAAPSASTLANMNAMKTTSAETSAASVAEPRAIDGSAAMRLNPHAESATPHSVSATTTGASRRRKASTTTSLAISSVDIVVSHELEKPFFERAAHRLDRCDLCAAADERRNERGHLVFGDVAQQHRILRDALGVARSQCVQRTVERRCGEGHAHRKCAQDLAHRAAGDHASAVENRDPVADRFDLREQMRVQEHRRAA